MLLIFVLFRMIKEKEQKQKKDSVNSEHSMSSSEHFSCYKDSLALLNK